MMLLLRDVQDRYLETIKTIADSLIYLFVIRRRSQDLDIWNPYGWWLCPFVSNDHIIFK